MKNLLARIFGKKSPMTNLTIIGNGNMARGIATRALAGGLTVEILGQDAAKAQELAAGLGAGVTFGTTVDAPQGDIVVLAVPFDAAKSVVSAYGETLAGKTVVDITNPVNFETFDSLVVSRATPPPRTSRNWSPPAPTWSRPSTPPSPAP